MQKSLIFVVVIILISGVQSAYGQFPIRLPKIPKIERPKNPPDSSQPEPKMDTQPTRSKLKVTKGMVRSPVTLSPLEKEFWSANPLFKVLENYAWDNNVMEKASDYTRKLAPNAGILRECSIGAEWTSGRYVMRRTVYRFFRCKVLRLPNPQQKGLNTDFIEVEFDNCV